MSKRKPTPDPEHKDAALLRRLVASFVRHPEAIEIEHVDQGANWMLRLRVHADDQSRCVGFGGQHVRALQAIFLYIGCRDGSKELKVALLEPERAMVRREIDVAPFMLRGDWDVESAVELLRAVLSRILAKPFAIGVVSSGASAEDSTYLEVKVDDDEREIMETDDKRKGILTSIRPIFNAIGKVNGVQLFVNLPEPIPEALRR